jgi:hypothetical protein
MGYPGLVVVRYRVRGRGLFVYQLAAPKATRASVVREFFPRLAVLPSAGGRGICPIIHGW